ncbi:MAG: thiamine phosphate synthase [Ruminococcus sp.]|nr:thiamine phosphate synthase [Ruminococcus sp.]
MSDIICVTNRKLCGGDFLAQIRKIAAAHPKAIILREKDMPPEEYAQLAKQVMEICAAYGTECILHSFADIAIELGAEAIHLPLHILKEMPEEMKNSFRIIGASCHSAEDAAEAERLGASYITAGHVFATDCKKGLPPRGLDFLREVCRTVHIPVYAIGGITPENIKDILSCGAAGGCIMSGLMQCEDPRRIIGGESFVK